MNTMRVSRPVAVSVVIVVVVGGFFVPVIGLIVPLFIIGGAIAARFKPRAFCTHACPRGKTLPLLARFSAYRPLPLWLRSTRLRMMGCAAMMGTSFLQLSRVPATWAGAQQLGEFFWGLCMITLTGAVVMALVYKPRSWCVVCPMGTMQDTVAAGGPPTPRAREGARDSQE